jgi:hypothetical protein
MELAQKQTWRPAKQNRGPRHKLMKFQPPDFWQRCPKHMTEKRQPLQQMLLGYLLVEDWNWTMSFILYKYQFKEDQTP